MNVKKCFKCKTDKPLSEFYKHKQMKDGFVNKCKECNKKDVSENYRKNIDHYKKYEKQRALLPHRVKARYDYSQTGQGKEKGNEAKKRWSENNAIKRGAATIVGNAVRDGRLKKQYSCSECNISGVRIHGHHEDYAKPLEVRWLCSACHSEWHDKNGAGING